MRILKGFKLYDLMVIALMAALGIASKPLIVPIAHMITGPLFIPGGALAGGFYMMWIVLAAGLVEKKGTATVTALVQALIVMVTGSFGSHGLASLITYTLPGILVDMFIILLRRPLKNNVDFFVAGILANMAGTYLSNLVFFRLPLVPLLLSLFSSILSGGIGGLIAYRIYMGVRRIGVGHEEE